MRLCIPIEFRPQGGGFYFLEAWNRFLGVRGIPVKRHISDSYDVLFTNHWMVQRDAILRAIWHNPDVRVVQRVDGSAQDYGRTGDWDQMQSEVNELADLTIFQSAYARYATREKYGVIKRDGPTIHNPVDTVQFSPDGKTQTLPGARRVACVTWSTNPQKGSQKIYRVAAANPDVEFILCGRYEDAPSLPNLHQQGVLDRVALARVLRSCHVLLTFSRNEACPNHVLEGMASGLPVLYDDSGGTPELVKSNGAPVDVNTFRARFDEVMSHREGLSRGARGRVLADNQPEVVFAKYLSEIERALERPPVVSPFTRRGLAALAMARGGALTAAQTARRAASGLIRGVQRR